MDAGGADLQPVRRALGPRLGVRSCGRLGDRARLLRGLPFVLDLRALRPLRYGSLPMLLLPVGQVQYWLHFAAELGHVLERPDQFEPDVAVRILAVSDADLHKTASELDLQHHQGEPRIGHAWPAVARKPPFTYLLGLDARRWLVFERSYGAATASTCSCSRAPLRFASPRPLSSGLEGLRWSAYQERCWKD